MNWLFIHRNFPGQYVHLARFLAGRHENVVAIGQQDCGQIAGVRRIVYESAGTPPVAFAPAREFEEATRNAFSVAEICRRLKGEGFVPDLVIGHNGWGETLHVKDVWPQAPLLSYFEFYYRSAGSDLDFDAEFPADEDAVMQVRLRNAVNLLGLEAADRGQTPTHWQRAQYPDVYRDSIAVVHEGVDCDAVRPDASARIWLPGRASLNAEMQVVTYCARNFEPYRGFHVFMRALPEILERLPQAHVILVGGDGVSYGRRPTDAPNWRQKMLAEVGGQIDPARVHFLKPLNFQQYLSILQVSTVHVYMTYPFVLSWSLLEAMAAGCAIVASRTPPVEEVVVDGENGWLTDFFDASALAGLVAETVRHRDKSLKIRSAARNTVVERYDTRTVALPANFALWESVMGVRLPWKSTRGRRRPLGDQVRAVGR